MLQKAYRQITAWCDNGSRLPRISVNVSARQFRRKDIVELVGSVLEETGLDAQYLELEITESVIMHDIESTITTFKKLKKMGVLYGFHLLAPFPGTEIRDKKDEYNIKILTDDWRMYHANKAIVETEHVTARILDEIADDWEKEAQRSVGSQVQFFRASSLEEANQVLRT